ncbi:endonuclease/exonuclease/phosphatase family protein [Dokdonia sp. Hel_I_53]|uniref:endonuclease/exonuclease/phosphatase family protein n=1 Tax=Dokdonia sp. Hel_I_53 TaxID=1566287 RepID=UPI00119C37E3|nr:endonuclease/exonuclease/phosphatase family protein [Dokdonia sp. Hel_I_53]TVZ50982.1 endonuclease/exonuclease/phosphatase (EEP) superfamily protein YafD [Dokdonia sp. Hel_I_53]
MLIALYVIFILFPLLPLLPSSHWCVRFFDFVRIQTAFIQILLLIAGFIFWSSFQDIHYILLGLLAAVLSYQLWLIQPYTPFYHRRKPQATFHEDKLTLITANVLQTNHNYDKFISIVKKNSPDIFITMESDQKWEKAISKAFPEYKHTVKVPLDNFYGMHMYSKVPFQTADVKYLVEQDIPSIHCELKFAHQQFNLIAIHPAPPSPTENETSKERDAELMIVGKICRESKDATVVCGDLNDVVWSKTSRLFTKITGYHDPRVGRGLYPSFHANYWLLRFPLDHLFYSKDLHVTKMNRLETFGSDHFAMYYEIAFPLKDTDVENPSIPEDVHEEIEDIIEEGHLSAKKTQGNPRIAL